MVKPTEQEEGNEGLVGWGFKSVFLPAESQTLGAFSREALLPPAAGGGSQAPKELMGGQLADFPSRPRQVGLLLGGEALGSPAENGPQPSASSSLPGSRTPARLFLGRRVQAGLAQGGAVLREQDPGVLRPP